MLNLLIKLYWRVKSLHNQLSINGFIGQLNFYSSPLILEIYIYIDITIFM